MIYFSQLRGDSGCVCISGHLSPGMKKERRRVSSRSIEFGLTQRPVQRLGGGQEPIPGRHGVGEGGHSALE